MQGSHKFWITCLLIFGFVLLGQVCSLEEESAAMDSASEQAAAVMVELEQTKEALAQSQSELAAAQSELAAARAGRQGTNSRRVGSGVSTGMSAAAIFIGTGRYCGANWASDLANKLSTTDHGTCRTACEADITCLAVSVSNQGCVKCKSNSIDWASGELDSSSTWTTYTKAPITCVSPKTYGINWRNTEAWCTSHQLSDQTSSTQRKQNTLNEWTAATRIGTQSPINTKELALTFAGRFWDPGAAAEACGCKASSFGMIHHNDITGGTATCNHMFGHNSYCPYSSPFEGGALITGCRYSLSGTITWSTKCSSKPQMTSFFG